MKPEWNVEDQVLRTQTSSMYVGNEKIYDWESGTSKEDKIAFVDEHTNGQLSYILALGEKFKQDEPNLPHDRFDLVKTISLKAWIKKNDTLGVIDNSYNQGKIHSDIVDRYIQHFDEKGVYDLYSDVVDEAFHRTLKLLEKEEEKWFNEHDEGKVLEKRILKYLDRLPAILPFTYRSSVGLMLGDENIDKDSREFTVPELREIADRYEKLDKIVNDATHSLTASLNFSYDNPKYSDDFIKIIAVNNNLLKITMELSDAKFSALMQKWNMIGGIPMLDVDEYYNTYGSTVEVVVRKDKRPIVGFNRGDGTLCEVYLGKEDMQDLCFILNKSQQFYEAAIQNLGGNALTNPAIKTIRKLANGIPLENDKQNDDYDR